jgi:hypothetical protein
MHRYRYVGDRREAYDRIVEVVSIRRDRQELDPASVEEIDLYDSVTVRPIEGDGAPFRAWIGDLAEL